MVNNRLAPVPKSIRDFIANPKTNGYRSLHVRINHRGSDYLIKIRTVRIDQLARNGMPYQMSPEGILNDAVRDEISELLQSIGDYSGGAHKRKDLIRLAGSEEIFAFTPVGDLHYFPKGSIVLDFAYKIHSSLGELCDGAIINGEWTPPNRVINDGDTVKIVTSDKSIEVDSDLESYCKTPRARDAVNKLLQKQRRQYSEKIGREILLQEMQRHGLSESILNTSPMVFILDILNLKNLSQLYIRIGQDNLSPRAVLYYLDLPKPDDTSDYKDQNGRNIIVINEISRGAHKFSNCCRPHPGQEGLVAALSERGVAFHMQDCNDLFSRYDIQRHRLPDVQWDMENIWEIPLKFNLRISGKTLSELLPICALISPTVQVHNLECNSETSGSPIVRLSVTLESFREASLFFKCFSRKSVLIENFSRHRR
jgi:GTP diphosphokinase / guanosine-3',5'-bis(diphosphate) 3'-diphosphatase